MNTAPQCRSCNCFRGGEQFKMRQFLVRKYGERAVQEMEMLAEMTKTQTADSLREKLFFYRKKNKSLKEAKYV
jgi:hypothetical protein